MTNNKRMHWAWKDMSFPGASNEPPCFTRHNDQDWAIWSDVNQDGKLFYSIFDGSKKTWGAATKVGAPGSPRHPRASTAPAASSYNKRLVVTWHERDAQDCCVMVLDQDGWSESVQFEDWIDDERGPAVVSTAKGDLIVYPQRHTLRYAYRLASENNWITKQNIEETSSHHTPALIAHDQASSGLVDLYWTDTNGSIRHTIWDFDGPSWQASRNTIRASVADWGPSACRHNGEVTLVWPKQQKMFYTQFSSGPHWSSSEKILFYSQRNHTDRRAALGVVDGSLTLSFNIDKTVQLASFEAAEDLTFVVVTDTHVVEEQEPLHWNHSNPLCWITKVVTKPKQPSEKEKIEMKKTLPSSNASAAFVAFSDGGMAIWGAHDDDNRLFASRYDATQNSWSIPKRVGNGELELTRSCATPPAAAVHQDRLLVSWRIRDAFQHAVIAYDVTQQTWGDVRVLDGVVAEHTGTAVASTSKGDLIAYSSHGNLRYAYKLHGEGWVQDRLFEQARSTQTPALVLNAPGSDRVDLYWTDPENDICMSTWDFTTCAWTAPTSVFNARADADRGPTLCWSDGTLFLGWVGHDRMFYSYRTQTSSWSPPSLIFGSIYHSQTDQAITLGALTVPAGKGAVKSAALLGFNRGGSIHTAQYQTNLCESNWKSNLSLIEVINDKLPDMEQEGTKHKFGPIDFVLVAGDLTYSEGLKDNQRFVDNFFEIFGKLKMPMHIVSGNHDTAKSVWPVTTDLFERIRSREGSYPYHFDCKGVRFIALRGDEHLPEGVSHNNPADNNAELEAALDIRDDTPVVVLCHYGFDDFTTGHASKDQQKNQWTTPETRENLIDRLQPHNLAAFLSGHSHYAASRAIRGFSEDMNLIGGTSNTPGTTGPYQTKFWVIKIIDRMLYASLIGWNWAGIGEPWIVGARRYDADHKYIGETRLITRKL